MHVHGLFSATAVFTMKVVVSNSTHSLEFCESDSVKVAKVKISERLKVPPEQ